MQPVVVDHHEAYAHPRHSPFSEARRSSGGPEPGKLHAPPPRIPPIPDIGTPAGPSGGPEGPAGRAVRRQRGTAKETSR
ncbi:hypothetical protein GCM10010497_47410 [Streptomyces cinereoruber]|uniref:Uncharacterized protein n=1 Tax=Streptomyces cinereoruber TaxID=67260 RepID=A0AAV4KND7_9ACTN|nr:hypothetical protein GCM10010497_47410 [Streptomyces cinereoruber]